MASRVSLIQSRSIYVGTSNSVAPSDGNLIVTGNVGIGTTSPTTTLDVRTDAGVLIKGASSDIDGRIALVPASGGRQYGLRNYGSSFGIKDESADVIRMYFHYDGNTGIGTTSPLTQLHVNDGVNVSNLTMLTLSQLGNTSDRDVVNLKMSFNNGAVPGVMLSAIKMADAGSSLGLSTGNPGNGVLSERMRITSAGNVGIGTTSPTATLDVAGEIAIRGGESADDARMYFRASDNSDRFTIETDLDGTTNNDLLIFRAASTDNILVLKGNGNVGIGTTSPGANLDIYSAGGPSLWLTAGGSGTGGLRIIKGDSGTAYINNQDSVGMQFQIAGGTKMVIDPSGNIGIGTTSPGSRLTVSKSYSTYTPGEYVFQVASGFNASNPMFGVEYSSDAAIVKIGYVGLGSTVSRIIVNGGTGNGDSSISFYNQSTLGTYISSATSYFASGNVGIGTTSPGDKLQVDGTIWAKPTSNGALGTALKLGVFTDSASTAAYEFKTNDSTDDFLGLYSNRWGINYEIHRDSSTGDKYVWAVYGDDGGHNMQLYNGSNTNSVRLSSFSSSWLNGGNVGIGTTSPNAPLHIIKDLGTSVSAVARLRGSNSTARTTRLQFEDYNGTLADGLIDFVIPTAGSATGARLDIGVDSAIVSVVKGGNVGIGTTSPSEKLHVNGDTRIVGNTYVGGIINAYQGDASIWVLNVGQAFTIKQNTGNVGIGTTSPNRKLYVVSSDWDNVTGGGVIFENSNTVGASLTLKPSASVVTNGSNGWAVYAGGPGAAISDGNLGFWAHGTNEARMVIQRGGNVGIGTISPTAKLEIRNDDGGSSETVDKFSIRGGDGGNNQIMKVEYLQDAGVLTLGYAGLTGDSVNLNGGTSNVGSTVALNNGGTTKVFFHSNGNSYFNAGNVGIGTTAPQQLLHVLGATNGYMMVQGANDAGQAGIYFKKEDTTGTMDRTKGLIVFHTNVGSGFGRGHLGFCLNSADSNTVVSISDEKFRMVDNGDFLADGDVVAYSTTISDERYKTNITPIDSALDKVNQMRGVSFDWTAVRSGREFGVIAQEIEKIAPEVVSEKELLNGETMKTVSYTSLVPFLIESIKELTARVEELEQKLKQ